MTKIIADKIEELEIAKKNVLTLLEDGESSVDFHGIEYWAERVDTLRHFIKNSL